MKTDKRNVLMFIAGVLCTIALFLITGAGHNTTPGKYQMEVAQRDRTHLVYVIDTTTGAVKWADSMDTPFPELKGN